MASQTVLWKPAFNYAGITTKGTFDELLVNFKSWSNGVPLPKLQLKDGWLTVTPQMAEELLRRNKSNRPPNLPTIRYYSQQMKDSNWPKTGQTLILDEDGNLLDGQQRLWACLLGGVPFITYVVTNVPKHENLFAFIDNGKSRSAADALKTAGFNGQSPAIVQLIDWAYAYDAGLFIGEKVRAHQRMAPVSYIHAAKNDYPNAEEAAHHAASTYSEASKLIDKRVVGFVTMKILDIYKDITLAENFFNGVSGAEPVEEDGIENALHAMMVAENAKIIDGMNPVSRLGNVIIAFNMWMAGEKPPKATKRGLTQPKWSYTRDENFPRLDGPVEDAVAAE